MPLRPVESNWHRNFMLNLTNSKTRYDEALSQSTSGKKLNNLSDNPADMAFVLDLRSKIGQIDQFEKNINSGTGFLNTAESALNQVQTMMYTVVNLAEQGASETTDAQGRRLLATRLTEIRTAVMDYANTEVMGKFVFSGSATDTKPFDIDPLAPVPPAGRPQAIGYFGNDDAMEIQAEFAVNVETNIPGSEVFGTGSATTPPHDIFSRLDDLIEHLNNNDTTALGTDIGSMSELINQVSDAIGELGNRTAHLAQIKGSLKSFKTSITAKMSSLEDANMAEAISNLAREEVALQAIMQSGSRIQRYTLMNYLG